MVFIEEDGWKRRTIAVEGRIPEPSGEWKDKVVYTPFVPSHLESEATNKEVTQPRTQLQELVVRTTSKFDVALEWTIPVFEEKVSKIDDFISVINGAFFRYLRRREDVLSP